MATMIPVEDRPERLCRIALLVAALHALATIIAFYAFAVMTSGGGEGYPDSPVISRMDGVLQGLAMPAAWLVERLLDPSRHYPPPFWIMVALRLTNSLLVGALVAWAWASIRRRQPIKADSGTSRSNQ